MRKGILAARSLVSVVGVMEVSAYCGFDSRELNEAKLQLAPKSKKNSEPTSG